MYIKNIKKQFGFSIIEALVGMFIFGLLVTLVYAFQKDIFSYSGVLFESLAVQDETRQALKKMTAEIRTASPSSLGAYPLVEIQPFSFVFYSNIDSDVSKERVRYFLDGSTLKRGVLKPSGSPLTYNVANEIITDVAHNVVNGVTPIFHYYDATYLGEWALADGSSGGSSGDLTLTESGIGGGSPVTGGELTGSESLGETSDIALVRLVKITVMVDKDASTSPAPMTLTTQVLMRNLKDNL